MWLTLGSVPFSSVNTTPGQRAAGGGPGGLPRPRPTHGIPDTPSSKCLHPLRISIFLHTRVPPPRVPFISAATSIYLNPQRREECYVCKSIYRAWVPSFKEQEHPEPFLSLSLSFPFFWRTRIHTHTHTHACPQGCAQECVYEHLSTPQNTLQQSQNGHAPTAKLTWASCL